jgi:hypothetical protein
MAEGGFRKENAVFIPKPKHIARREIPPCIICISSNGIFFIMTRFKIVK